MERHAPQHSAPRRSARWLGIAGCLLLAGITVGCVFGNSFGLKISGTQEAIDVVPRRMEWIPERVPGELGILVSDREEAFEFRFRSLSGDELEQGVVYVDPRCNPESDASPPEINRLGQLVYLGEGPEQICGQGGFYFSRIERTQHAYTNIVAVQFEYRATASGRIQGKINFHADPDASVPASAAELEQKEVRFGQMSFVRYDFSPSAWSRNPAYSPHAARNAKPGYDFADTSWITDDARRVNGEPGSVRGNTAGTDESPEPVLENLEGERDDHPAWSEPQAYGNQAKRSPEAFAFDDALPRRGPDAPEDGGPQTRDAAETGKQRIAIREPSRPRWIAHPGTSEYIDPGSRPATRVDAGVLGAARHEFATPSATTTNPPDVGIPTATPLDTRAEDSRVFEGVFEGARTLFIRIFDFLKGLWFALSSL